MGQRYVGKGEFGVVHFVGYSMRQRVAMAWSLFFNCRVVLPVHFEVTTSLPEPEPSKVKEKPAP